MKDPEFINFLKPGFRVDILPDGTVKAGWSGAQETHAAGSVEAMAYRDSFGGAVLSDPHEDAPVTKTRRVAKVDHETRTVTYEDVD